MRLFSIDESGTGRKDKNSSYFVLSALLTPWLLVSPLLLP